MIETVEQLEDRLSEPSDAAVRVMGQLDGDIVVLGAGGKMGPLPLRRTIASLRLSIERGLMKLGIGSHFAGRTLRDVIRQDLRLRQREGK